MDSTARQLVSEALQLPLNSLKVSAIGGGSINRTYRIDSGSKLFFCKINSSSGFSQMFKKELRGLSALRDARAIKVPNVLGIIDDDNLQILLLEYIEEGSRTTRFWKSFGEQLAMLHSNISNRCGFDEDNYMGALPQVNTWMSDWCTFFIQNRLVPQVELAAASNLLTATQVQQFKTLYARLPDILPGSEFSLLHGDLWSGNFLCDQIGNPVLIDPAVYYGNRYVDIAMTTLFGGFDPQFYEAYYYHSGSAPATRAEIEVYNLYPLLIHLNLFGKGYLSSIMTTLKQF